MRKLYDYADGALKAMPDELKSLETTSDIFACCQLKGIISLFEKFFPFRDQLELFANQKHMVLPNSPYGGLIVTRISRLFQFKCFASHAPGFVWIQQGQVLRLVDCKRLELAK